MDVVEIEDKGIVCEDPAPTPESKPAVAVKSTGEARKRRTRTHYADEEGMDEISPLKVPIVAGFDPSGAAVGKPKRAGADIALMAAPLRLPRARPYMATENLDAQACVDTDDVCQGMRMVENKRRVYNPDAKFVKYRRVLVDWMSEVGEEFHLHTSTIHVAILFMDRILEAVPVPRNQLQLVSMCCIIIAAKYEEAERVVPTASDLNDFAKKPYTVEQIYAMEVLILQRLDWHLTEIVPLHYLGTYMAKGIVFHEDRVDNKPMIEKVPKYLAKYNHFFSELAMQDYTFQQFSSSLTAAAIVMASRRALKLTPLWRDEITSLTGYTVEESTPCYEMLWQYFESSFPDAAAAYKQSSPSSVANA